MLCAVVLLALGIALSWPVPRLVRVAVVGPNGDGGEFFVLAAPRDAEKLRVGDELSAYFSLETPASFRLVSVIGVVGPDDVAARYHDEKALLDVATVSVALGRAKLEAGSVDMRSQLTASVSLGTLRAGYRPVLHLLFRSNL